jgi:hypothetical protein
MHTVGDHLVHITPWLDWNSCEWVRPQTMSIVAGQYAGGVLPVSGNKPPIAIPGYRLISLFQFGNMLALLLGSRIFDFWHRLSARTLLD